MTHQQLESMRRHVDACRPLEACGLLAGRHGTVHEIMPVENEARSAVRFRMKPAEQLAAFNRMDTAGLELVGIFHSHPAGPEEPSATDVTEATYPVVYLIWSRRTGDWQVRGFWIEQERISEVKLEVAGGG